MMSYLERYKKKGGFYQLLTLIEGADREKAEKFLHLIEQESTVWAQAIQEKRLSIEKLATLPSKILGGALDVLPPRILAVALWKENGDQRMAILNALTAVQQKKVENVWEQEPEPRPGDIYSCQIKVFQAIREFLLHNPAMRSSLPPHLQIPDNIESQLTQQELHMALNQVSSTPIHKDTQDIKVLSPEEGSADSVKALINELQKQIQTLVVENQRLKKQLQEAEEKLDKIRKWVA